MRIISPFKDYYDIGMAYDREPEPLYLRTPRSVENRWGVFSFDPGRLWRGFPEGPNVDAAVIGFCGKWYSATRIAVSADRGVAAKVCYRAEDADNFIRTHFKKDEIAWYFSTHQLPRRHAKLVWSWRRIDLERHYENFNRRREDRRGHPPFEGSDCPIVIHTSHKGGSLQTFNGRLRDWEFARVFDPYKAYQEIAMWLGNQAQPRKPIPPISDEVMAQAKGFDKWSFRKPPN